ncbi:putative serine/threonine-protein kinase-like protein CCR3 [Cajanus cajan]|uniref:non-specific serine/threonine protein kinase n=1 Tax=Cajanus cajan TaxID=3821 RepID=A0A151SZI4_CAJCA|nr:putative serine/threonine-protein kinase-like protein CCR3 [Cajanus cajan]KYP60216.1 Putative serine/threonine-protein kinase-like protein CCR3 [Cajanus cajan]
MKTSPSASVTLCLAVAAVFFLSLPPSFHALGSGATLAISDASATVCGVVASESTRRIECYHGGNITPIVPNVSFSTISGGRDYFCGIRSSNSDLLCWDTTSSFERKRLYNDSSVPLENLAVGDTHVCATEVGGGAVRCWRTGDTFQLPSGSDQFASISSGSGFSCGILKNDSRVRCWGNTNVSEEIENRFGNMSMLSLVAGGSHVCGLNSTGFLVCEGSNGSGQVDFPRGGAFEFGGLALGAEHSCAIRGSNGSVVCWGGNGRFSVNVTQGVSFEVIVSGSNFVCGLTTNNLTVLCWGPGWSNSSSFELPLPSFLPGPCVQSSCGECGSYLDSQSLCSGSGNICKPMICRPQTIVPPPPPLLSPPPPPPPSVLPSSPPPPPPPPSSSRSKTLTRGLLAFAIIGSAGAFAGICTIVYCLWSGVCFGKKKVHNSVQPTITRGSSGSNGGGASNNSNSSISSMIMRQTSIIMRRQRSGTSSTKHTDRAEEFTLAELVAATNNFSLENKIGAGSFGVVYKGKLADGREVAIKRGETSSKMKKFQEKESAFDSELAFLSRLHHKHLVGLVGFCEEKDERLLVYEYMKNGALYDHLHDKNNVEKGSSVLNWWKIRIKIALDASRGIEYLHNYAVPSIIHRDIKSSNILLDATWTARVSDFGLSLMSPEPDSDYRPMKAAGTVGYIDPEYYGLNVLTAKSDVYGLGVVLLELLTGKRAIFKYGEDGGTPLSVVDFAVPAIMAGELVKILDPRVGPPDVNEAEAVELVAYTAIHCVNLEGKDRPTMADIVVNLERALSICDSSQDNISSGTICVVSE